MKRSTPDAAAPAAAPSPNKRQRKPKKPKPTHERDCRDLFALRSTVACATALKCAACANKLCLHGTPALPLPPPPRPEQCPRERHGLAGAAKKAGGASARAAAPLRTPGAAALYRGLRVLTVGDGDLTFSLAVAQSGECAGVDASSYESEATLREVYPNFPATLAALRAAGARVAFGVDATRLTAALPWGKEAAGGYDRIVWNFPCQAVAGGMDGQSETSGRADGGAVADNQSLVRRFGQCAPLLLRPGGEVHVAHKTREPFSYWDLPRCVQGAAAAEGEEAGAAAAAAAAAGAAAAPRLSLRGALVFDRSAFPPYRNVKALDNKSFNMYDAVLYVFRSSGGDGAAAATFGPGDAGDSAQGLADGHADAFADSAEAPGDVAGGLAGVVRVTPGLLRGVREAVSPRDK